MLRVAARSGKNVRLQSTAAPPKPPTPTPAPPKKSIGMAKKIALVFGSVGVTTSGILIYAEKNPEFRHKFEETVPKGKEILDIYLSEKRKNREHLSELKDKVMGVTPKKKKEEPVLDPLQLERLPPIEKKAVVHIDPVDVRPPVVVASKDIVTPEQAAKKNTELEERLLAAIASAERQVQKATDAKMHTIHAVRNHAALLKKTVDDAKNANWEAVTSALSETEKHARQDAGVEVDSRNYIDNLRKVIADGKASKATASNPLLLNATETANKLSHQVDELNHLVNKARKEAHVFTQYKDLIDRSRQQFAQEMQAILPNVDVHAKDKNLTEDELNALIAHAHLRVDQLRRQLVEQQVLEEQNIVKALEAQKRADEQAADERLALELKRVSEQQQVDVERQVSTSRSVWETETEEKLRRATSAHADHLEQVIRTQRQLFEIEQNQKVEEAVTRERELHSRHVGVAIGRLEGIEAALSSRVALDAENRRAKQFWIACHNLIESVVHGVRAGKDIDARRAPLSEQLGVLKEVNPEDSFVQSVVSSFPEQSVSTGVYTLQDLKNRFDKIYSSGRRTSGIDESGGSLGKYAWSYVRSFFLIDLPRRFSYDDKIDPAVIDNVEVLARAAWFIERDDLESAARLLNLLEGQPRQLARDWIADTRAHLETKFLAQLLVAHAAVQSIRSTY